MGQLKARDKVLKQPDSEDGFEEVKKPVKRQAPKKAEKKEV